MRRLSALSLFVLAVFLGQAGRGSAQQGMPQGSYQQSCSDVSVKNGVLYARCKDERGKMHHARLIRYENCAADIANKNGALICSQEGGGAPTQPGGSYTESCKEIHMKGSTLHAICKSVDGHEAPTSLRDANRCAQGVVNINGILNCESGSVLPPGSYIATCRDVRLQGTTLYATCNDGKDHWLSASLRDPNKCGGDIANQNGTLRCTALNREKR